MPTIKPMHNQLYFILIFACSFLIIAPAQAQETAPKKPELQYASGEIQIPAASADEPKVKFNEKTVQLALKYLDDGALAWTRERNCVACHSTGVYLAERTALTPLFGPPKSEVRDEFVATIPTEVPKPTIRDGVKTYPSVIFSVWRTLGLAQWDKYVTGKLSAETEKSINDLLLRQSDDGLWSSANQVEVPYIRTDFELGLEAFRAMNAAPGWLDSITDETVKKRVAKLKQALAAAEPANDFERVQQLQLAAISPELVSKNEIETARAILTKLQKPDGGWSTRSFSPTKDWGPTITKDNIEMIDSEPDAADPASDPFMTAFAIVLLRESGTPVNDSRIQKGIAWLKSNQRESGRWWMKSLYKNTKHYITYISTAQVLRALALCDELPKNP